MHISYKPLWHTLIERNMRKEDLRLAAGLTTNMIANMGKEGKHISMDTLARICETLDCSIMDVIELVSDEPSADSVVSIGNVEYEVDMRFARQRIRLCCSPDMEEVYAAQPDGTLLPVRLLNKQENASVKREKLLLSEGGGK